MNKVLCGLFCHVNRGFPVIKGFVMIDRVDFWLKGDELSTIIIIYFPFVIGLNAISFEKLIGSKINWDFCFVKISGSGGFPVKEGNLLYLNMILIICSS